jgi:ribonuclease E
MVLESNRDRVLRRLVECLGRDRTRHQVAVVSSLGLVQMTRKRIGTGLLESFSENCEHCHGRGVVIKDQPVDPEARSEEGEGRRSGRRRGRRGANGEGGNDSGEATSTDQHAHAPSPKDVAAMARHEKPAEGADGDSFPGAAADDDARPTGSEPAAEAPADPAAPAPAEVSAPSPEEAPVEAAAEAPVEAPAETEPEPEVSAEVPAEAEKPRVVTRTRRRSASRPAGPPVSPTGSADPASPVAATSSLRSSGAAGTVPESGVVEPGTVDAEPGVGTPLAVEAETGVDGASSAPVVEHVPIKKKGSRKR